MHDDWKERLLTAIDADGRSDRAISLASGLGPNFVQQMRGTKAVAPKKPNIEYVRRLAATLGKELSEIVGQTEDDAERRLRSALLAYGVDRSEIPQALKAIKGFVEDGDDAQQQSDRPHDQSAPANRRHESEPSR